jgi:uncharacterized protein YutE (UPF0331/DUF86 family)
MVERDLVLSKAATIDRCLARVAEVRSRPPGALLPVDIEDIVVLNVTRAVQAAADLAAHVVAAEGYGLPDSLAASFTLLEGQGVIDVDARIVEAIASHRIEDLRQFAARMVERYAP